MGNSRMSMPVPDIRVVTAGTVIAGEDEFSPGTVEIKNGRIVRVRRGRAARPDLDAGDGILAPGLIDLQINGAVGVDFLTSDPTEFDRARGYVLSTGTTAF